MDLCGKQPPPQPSSSGLSWDRSGGKEALERLGKKGGWVRRRQASSAGRPGENTGHGPGWGGHSLCPWLWQCPGCCVRSCRCGWWRRCSASCRQGPRHPLTGCGSGLPAERQPSVRHCLSRSSQTHPPSLPPAAAGPAYHPWSLPRHPHAAGVHQCPLIRKHPGWGGD